MTPPVVLTIAGSDSGGGAGIQADLRTFAALAVHGASAITAVTAQNTMRVEAIHRVPASFVDAQIAAVLADIKVDAVKTGMLAMLDTIEVVARRAEAGDLPNLVVDPVMVASSGDRLLDEDAEAAYLERLLPLASVATPNQREAGVLLGRPVVTIDDCRDAVIDLATRGLQTPVVTGGQLEGDLAVDVAWIDGALVELDMPMLATSNIHGTGCSFASAIAAGLASGLGAAQAIREAKSFVHQAIRGAVGWRLGSGRGPIDHLSWGPPRNVG